MDQQIEHLYNCLSEVNQICTTWRTVVITHTMIITISISLAIINHNIISIILPLILFILLLIWIIYFMIRIHLIMEKYSLNYICYHNPIFQIKYKILTILERMCQMSENGWYNFDLNDLIISHTLLNNAIDLDIINTFSELKEYSIIQDIFNSYIHYLHERNNEPSTVEVINDTCNKNVDNLSECIICLDNISEDKKYVMANCSCLVIFHKECISTWLKLKSQCPLCRKQDNKISNISS